MHAYEIRAYVRTYYNSTAKQAIDNDEKFDKWFLKREFREEKEDKMTDIVSKIKKYSSECWTNILIDARDAVVYIDHRAIECLHWHTAGKGYLTLKDAGAVAVYEFGMYHFQYVETRDVKKTVIISTSGNPAFYQRTLKMILAKNTFETCIVHCAAPSSTADHDGTFSPEDRLDYNKLKKDIRSWMALENITQESTVTITYTPIFVALLNKNLLVTPPFGDLMPPLDKKITDDTYAKLKILAYSFRQLFDNISARLDVYSLGKFSEYLAANLENDIPGANQRNHVSETSEIGVSLILIDRTLDLGTPTSNNMESFLTKILQTCPRLPYHDNDVAINTSPAFGAATSALRASSAPGSLAGIGETLMDILFSQKEKKLLGTANQFLNDMALTKDSPKLRTPARISGHSLEKMLSKIQTTNSVDFMSVHPEKLEFILAIIGASTSPKTGQLELLTSLEKLALQSLSVSRESSSILLQLCNIIRTRSHRGLDIENLLALLVHVYAVAGTQIRFSERQEHQLQESISDAIFQDFQVSKENPLTGGETAYRRTLLLLSGANDVDTVRETSHRIAMRIIDTLRSVAEQRTALQDYRYCMLKPNSEEAMRYVGVLEQVTKDVCYADSDRELRDLQKKSTSLISAGFNLILRGKTKRRPRDNPYVLIYIIGGITTEEAKVIQEAASSNGKEKAPFIMLAGSRLLNPLDIVDKIFFC